MQIKELKNEGCKFVKKHKKDIIIILGFGAVGVLLGKCIKCNYYQNLSRELTIHDVAFELAVTDIISEGDINKICEKAKEYKGNMHKMFRGIDSKSINKIVKNTCNM